MSPILDLQRKLHERGRIRLGQKNDQRGFPQKLKTFKVTSSDRQAVDDAASLYGGKVERFLDSQWGVVTEATSLDVILPPDDMAFSQWNEMWSGGGCQRRCDGNLEINSDGPCLCPSDPEERSKLASKGRACKPTTRLSMMLPDLPGYGLWRLESHGFYAATELAGSVSMIHRLAPQTLINARLTLDERTVLRAGETRRFVVPVLDLADVRMRSLMAPTGDGVSVQIETGGLTPIPAQIERGAPIAEQLAALPEAPKPRSNAAAEIRSTGLEPPGMTSGRPVGGSSVNQQAEVQVVTDAGETDDLVADGGGLSDNTPPPSASSEQTLPVAPTDNVPGADAWQGLNRYAQGLAARAWPDDTQAMRKRLVGIVSECRTDSSKELTGDEWHTLTLALEQIAEGVDELWLRSNGDWVVRRKLGGAGQSSQGAPDGGAAAGHAPGPALSDWPAFIESASGPQRAGALKRARRIAGEVGAELPQSIDEVAGEVAAAVLAELDAA